MSKVMIKVISTPVETMLDSRIVLNQEALQRDTIEKCATRCKYPRGKAWVRGNFANWLLHKGKAREITLKDIKKTPKGKFKLLPSIDKTGAEIEERFLQDLREGKKIYFVSPGDEIDYLTLERIIRHLNSEDRNWSRVSVSQMLTLIKDKLQKRKNDDPKTHFKHVLNSGPYQWVEILTEIGLKDEGQKLENCIREDRSYAIGLREGSSRIFSLRDMSFKNPKVAIEVNNDIGGVWEVAQIEGKRNNVYLEYSPHVLDFIKMCKSKGFRVIPEILKRWGIVKYRGQYHLLSNFDTNMTNKIRFTQKTGSENFSLSI